MCKRHTVEKEWCATADTTLRCSHTLVGCGASTILALAPDPIMLAYLRSAALLALILLAVMVADACSEALLALAPVPIMLAYLRSAALLAPALLAVMVADA